MFPPLNTADAATLSRRSLLKGAAALLGALALPLKTETHVLHVVPPTLTKALDPIWTPKHNIVGIALDGGKEGEMIRVCFGGMVRFNNDYTVEAVHPHGQIFERRAAQDIHAGDIIFTGGVHA